LINNQEWMALMRFFNTKLAACFFGAACLTGCGGDGDDRGTPLVPATKIAIDFNTQAEGWAAKFADYPVGEEEFYELSSALETLPASLGNNKKGIKISGNNHSDDLFMFVTKKFTGFEPNTRYDIQFELGIGTNVHSNCSGIGGSPGNSVYVKAGASKIEPQPVNDGTGFYLLNIDKNNQAAECENPDTSFKKKTLKSEAGKFTTYSDASGALWVVFGTDSGYEGTTSIYFVDALVSFTKR
jgi:hypothetical protein